MSGRQDLESVRRECEELAQRELAAETPPPLSEQTQRLIRAAFTVPQLPRRTSKSA